MCGVGHHCVGAGAASLSKDFYIAKYPVTQAQYKAVTDNNPSFFKGDNNPVEEVSWGEANWFCTKLNELTKSIRPAGYRFDLPTEVTRVEIVVYDENGNACAEREL